MALVSVQDLSFSYPLAGHLALDGVNLDVEVGEYLCVCGKSGCGKTTLLRQLKTVLAPHGEVSGTVLFDGRPLAEIPAAEQAARIGFVMQDPDAQIVTDKVWHELAFGLESTGCDQRTLRMRVAEMASFFGIESWFHDDVSQLSGGQRQLLNLASVMTMHPDVLLLDEPTSQLDPIAATEFLQVVRRVNQELGITIIITEHRLEEVFPVADRVVVMDEGRIVVSSAPREAAGELYARASAMTLALPTPARVVHGVMASGSAALASMVACPLTIREGRTWLGGFVHERMPAQRSVPMQFDKADQAAPVARLRDVWFRYERDGRDVLRGVDLDVPQGKLLAVMGGNGAGKTTLLKALCGAAKPYRGKIRLFGRRVGEYGAGELFRDGVAMLPQNPSELFAKTTVHDELAEMLEDTGLDASARDARISEVMRSCDIERLAHVHPQDLSGGEQQRVALAKVLLTRPRILLLDEPTKGMDALFKRSFADMLASLTHDGVTVVMVSHDVEFCARCADAVALLFDGEIAALDAPRGLFSSTSFYTTAASRMSRGIFENAITDEDVIELCLS